MFATLIPRLADNYRLIAPDYPGFGHSDTPPPETFAYSFDHLADCVGTAVAINNETRGVIEGEDFMQAWLRIWLGREPADAGLKQNLLGAD